MSQDQLGYSYEESQNRDTSGGHYGDPIDQKTAETTTDLLTTDEDYHEAIQDDVSSVLVEAFNTAVTAEAIHTGGNGVLLEFADDDVAGSKFANLGDNGIVPGSVTITIVADDGGPESLDIVDTDVDGTTGTLAGTGTLINATGTINYLTGAWTIVTTGTNQADTDDFLADYTYSRDALVGDVGLTAGALGDIADELEGDAPYLAAIGAALAADAAFLAAVQEITFPVHDAEITVNAETTETIAVDIQMVDLADAIAEHFTNVKVFVTTDLTATPDGLPGNITMAATDGQVLAIETADIIFSCLTTSTGMLTLTFTDAIDQDITLYVQVVLPNGKTVNSGVIVFVDDTP